MSDWRLGIFDRGFGPIVDQRAFIKMEPEPPQVGNWHICDWCGNVENGYPSCHDSVNMWKLRLCEEDWLRCHEPRALEAMMGHPAFPRIENFPHASTFPSPMDERAIRCIFGNTFDPFIPSPDLLAWRDGTVRRLAESLAKRICVRCNGMAAYDEPIESHPDRVVMCRVCDGTGVDSSVDASRLPYLADALEESGLTHEPTLRHLREPGAVHTPQCHVLRAILS